MIKNLPLGRAGRFLTHIAQGVLSSKATGRAVVRSTELRLEPSPPFPFRWEPESVFPDLLSRIISVSGGSLFFRCEPDEEEG